jgi:signal transduction histidine kinase
LAIVVDEVRRLETLLNSVRLLTRPAVSSRKQPLDLNRVLDEVLVLIEPLLQGQKIEIFVQREVEPLMIEGDADQLKQVFLNLFQNAIDALSGKGKLVLTSEKRSKFVEIRIEDNGPGIPASIQERVFDPFFTTKPEGSGLGLAISRNIIRDHGGSLSLRSAPAEGATFLIELPLPAG